MSYDIQISVKIDGYDGFAVVAAPEYDSPTYNLGQMFRSCTGWDFEQGQQYKCADMIGNICKGITELKTNPQKYKNLEPENGWGTLHDAVLSLESMRDCIYEQAENIPIEHLYIRW